MLLALFLDTVSNTASVRVVIVLSILACVVRWYWTLPTKPSFPEAELDENDQSWHDAFMRAKTNFGIKPFIFGRRDKKVVILPNYLFEELKNLPDDQLSFRQAMYAALQGHWTGLATEAEPFARTIQNELTMNINSTLAIMHDEINYAIQTEIGECMEWTPVNVHKKLLRIVALASGRILVGLPLSRDEEWVDSMINYAVTSMKAVGEVNNIPRLLRPFVVPFLPSIRKTHDLCRRIEQKLVPGLQAIVEASQGNKIDQSSDDDFRLDSMHEGSHNVAAWSLKYYKPDQIPTAKSVAHTVLAASMAAIHTTTLALTNILYDIAAHPEWAVDLREELFSALAKEGAEELRKKNLPNLRKLDSFIKESQRINPLGAAPLVRLVTAKQGITLSSGDFLPHGTTISVAQARQTSALPSQYLSPMPPQPSLDEFHPWRFSDMRAYPGEQNKHQFVTTTTESIVFGHGRWACPGRFFASNEIKANFVEILKRFDVGVGPNGEGEGGQFKRPATFNVELGYYPDPTAEIYFKRRTVKKMHV